MFVDDQVGADILHEAVTELVHFLEFEAGVHVQEGEREGGRMEGLLGEADHDGGILAD